MAWGRKKDGEGADGEFDAVHAAEELNEVLSAEGETPPQPELDEYIRTLESEIEGLNNLLIQKETLLARAEAKTQESLEEIERVKKRLQTEADQRVENRIGNVINEVLDVGDDIARAIRAATDDPTCSDAVVEGIELVRQSFGKRLEKLGVTRMQALGAHFDPAQHDAVSALPVDDPAQNGIVLAVVQEGYAIHGQVLRAAKVAVGKLSS